MYQNHRTGNLHVDVPNPHYSRNLLSRTSFFNTSCKCYPSLNTLSVVINCPDISRVADTEIVENLQDHDGTAARRIKIKIDNRAIFTSTTILIIIGLPSLGFRSKQNTASPAVCFLDANKACSISVVSDCNLINHCGSTLSVSGEYDS